MTNTNNQAAAPVLFLAIWARCLLIFEKVAWTFGYQLFTVLVTVGTVNLYRKQSWFVALDTAGWAALLALGTALITTLTPLVTSLTGWRDVAVRIVLTWLQSFVGSMIASTTSSLISFSWQGAATVAIVATFPAVLKVLLALNASHSFSASVVPVKTLNAVGHAASR